MAKLFKLKKMDFKIPGTKRPKTAWQLFKHCNFANRTWWMPGLGAVHPSMVSGAILIGRQTR